jgi:hypothetical protein
MHSNAHHGHLHYEQEHCKDRKYIQILRQIQSTLKSQATYCLSNATISKCHWASLLALVPVRFWHIYSLGHKKKKQIWLQTCARCISCAHCDLHQVKDTFHSPCPGPAVVGTHTGHWSAKPSQIHIKLSHITEKPQTLSNRVDELKKCQYKKVAIHACCFQTAKTQQTHLLLKWLQSQQLNRRFTKS